jgi:hypothetical protein
VGIWPSQGFGLALSGARGVAKRFATGTDFRALDMILHATLAEQFLRDAR